MQAWYQIKWDPTAYFLKLFYWNAHRKASRAIHLPVWLFLISSGKSEAAWEMTGLTACRLSASLHAIQKRDSVHAGSTYQSQN